MKNRKIIVDREEPSSIDIKPNMDFDKVVKRVTGTTKYNSITKKVVSGITVGAIIIAIIITGIFLSNQESKTQKNKISISNNLSTDKHISKKPGQPIDEQSDNKPIKQDLTNMSANATSGKQLMTKSSTRNPSLNTNTYAGEKYNSLDDFYKKTSLPLQLFTIMATRDTTITGEQGTKLLIKANSFVDSMNKLAKGQITISLKECYTLEDMLKERLTTMANGKILESGGMIYIEAKSGNEQLKLKKFEEIEMYNPISEVMADTNMFLFYGGTKLPAENINWTVDNYSRTPYPIAALTGGKYYDTTSISYFASHFRFAKEKMIESLRKKDSIEFSVSFAELMKPIGSTGGEKDLLPGMPLCEFLALVENNYIPSIQGATRETAFQFKVMNKVAYEKYLKEYKQYIEDKNLKKGNFKLKYDASDVFYAPSRYTFFIEKMGWVNCDRYSRPELRVNEIHFTLNSKTEENVELSFNTNGRPSIIKAMKAGNTWCFPNIPVNKEVTVTGTFLKDGLIQKASKVFKVQKKETLHQLEYTQ
ncbi:MAG: hypothetical protein V4547_15450 [Bacteroidota bacterium]